jgi:hypothetical protein
MLHIFITVGGIIDEGCVRCTRTVVGTFLMRQRHNCLNLLFASYSDGSQQDKNMTDSTVTKSCGSQGFNCSAG